MGKIIFSLLNFLKLFLSLLWCLIIKSGFWPFSRRVGNLQSRCWERLGGSSSTHLRFGSCSIWGAADHSPHSLLNLGQQWGRQPFCPTAARCWQHLVSLGETLNSHQAPTSASNLEWRGERCRLAQLLKAADLHVNNLIFILFLLVLCLLCLSSLYFVISPWFSVYINHCPAENSSGDREDGNAHSFKAFGAFWDSCP